MWRFFGTWHGAVRDSVLEEPPEFVPILQVAQEHKYRNRFCSTWAGCSHAVTGSVVTTQSTGFSAGTPSSTTTGTGTVFAMTTVSAGSAPEEGCGVCEWSRVLQFMSHTFGDQDPYENACACLAQLEQSVCRAPESWHHLPLLGPQRCDLRDFPAWLPSPLPDVLPVWYRELFLPWLASNQTEIRAAFCERWTGCRTPEVATPSLFGSTTTTVVTSSDLVGSGTTAATTAMDEDVTFFSSPASATTTAPQATHGYRRRQHLCVAVGTRQDGARHRQHRR